MCAQHLPAGRMNNVLCMATGPFKVFTHAIVLDKLSIYWKDNYKILTYFFTAKPVNIKYNDYGQSTESSDPHIHKSY